MCGWDVVRALLITGALAGGSATQLAAQQWQWPDEPENLQVLPEDFTGERLRPVMTGFTRALGVRCSHCHVGEEGQPLSTFDFPSDENPNKERARTMLRMLGDINETLKTLEPSGAARVNMWCHTCHRGRPRPMTLPEELAEVVALEGVDAAFARYEELRTRFYGRGAYDFGEPSLNAFGYELLGRDEVDAAIRAFRLNSELFPESANVWDSLAEGYMTAGERDLAIEYYETSLSIDPDNANAVRKLQELRAAGGS